MRQKGSDQYSFIFEDDSFYEFYKQDSYEIWENSVVLEEAFGRKLQKTIYVLMFSEMSLSVTL